jgi:hypothetical protein
MSLQYLQGRTGGLLDHLRTILQKGGPIQPMLVFGVFGFGESLHLIDPVGPGAHAVVSTCVVALRLDYAVALDAKCTGANSEIYALGSSALGNFGLVQRYSFQGGVPLFQPERVWDGAELRNTLFGGIWRMKSEAALRLHTRSSSGRVSVD